MQDYNYRALDNEGKIVLGSINEENILNVRLSLKNQGLLPVRIENVRDSMSFDLKAFKYKKQIKSDVLSQFCRQLAIIIASGINILKGLEIMADKASNKRLRSEITQIHQEVQKGRTIAEAMSGRESYMPNLLTSMVATGETSGSLDEVLINMGEFYENDSRIKQKIKSAAIYPIVMIIMAIGLIIFFFNFLLPQMVTLIAASGSTLPLLTRIVIGIGNIVRDYFLLIFVVLLMIGAGFAISVKTSRGRLVLDRLIFKTPILGVTMRNVTTLRFARTAHILIKSGIPMLQSLDFIKQNLDNALAEQSIDFAIEGLQKGESLALNLDKAKYFDSMAIQMIHIGEETGELENILKEMGDFYNNEAEAGFSKLVAMVEPIMLLVIGSVVSIVIISVMLPMMGMLSNIRR
ncbi:MAG: type II secretion system F family protein [Peptococcaceae bacterium]|nr:type II secretion system F family protein [Peptococcaceae bacterium]